VACATREWRRDTYRVLVRKPERKRPLGRPTYRWKNNIKMSLQEIGCKDVYWISLAQDRQNWWVLVNTVMALHVPYYAWIFLSVYGFVTFSRRTQLHEA